MSRLKKLKKLEKQKKDLMIKTASPVMTLDSFSLKSGDVMGISTRLVNNKPWFQVYHEFEAGASSSLYDGPDIQRAFNMYMDILTAFIGVSAAEKFSKKKNMLQKQIEDFSGDPRVTRKDEYFNLLHKKPLFLGVNDF